MQREIYIPKVLAFEQGLKHYTNAIKKNSITFQDVEDTSFFDTDVRIEIYSFWGATYGELPVKALRVV